MLRFLQGKMSIVAQPLAHIHCSGQQYKFKSN
uniref:Uncharacterized protein n=1 Tax=Arundo donax TaxID=35708 RepID=A0A0A9BE40_ARUDO